MSDDIDTIRTELWAKMRKKKYRDNFVSAHLSTNIAAQMQTIREAQNLTQKDLAEKTGMAQARISIMENPSYDKFTLSTLKRIASAFDVALIVRFIPFSELVNWVAELTPEKMMCPTFAEDSINQPAVITGRAFTGTPGAAPETPLVRSTLQNALKPLSYAQQIYAPV